jgi:hypothetical protein
MIRPFSLALVRKYFHKNILLPHKGPLTVCSPRPNWNSADYSAGSVAVCRKRDWPVRGGATLDGAAYSVGGAERKEKKRSPRMRTRKRQPSVSRRIMTIRPLRLGLCLDSQRRKGRRAADTKLFVHSKHIFSKINSFSEEDLKNDFVD